jgi:hypothetical protein
MLSSILCVTFRWSSRFPRRRQGFRRSDEEKEILITAVSVTSQPQLADARFPYYRLQIETLSNSPAPPQTLNWRSGMRLKKVYRSRHSRWKSASFVHQIISRIILSNSIVDHFAAEKADPINTAEKRNRVSAYFPKSLWHWWISLSQTCLLSKTLH